MDELDKDIEEKTKQMLDKQANCNHWQYHTFDWAFIDDCYISLYARGGQNIPMKFRHECSNCGKWLN